MTKLVLFAILAAAVPTSAFAQAAKPAEDKKLDISDLQDKYWAPKDTDFSVVQNRTYSKEGRWFITPQFGPLVNDSYSTGNIWGVTGNYFFSERYGAQLSYQKANLKDGQVISSLQTLSTGVAPDHDKLNSFVGAGFSFVPFYAKMSLLGKRIMYFDMAITPVIGETTYTQTGRFGSPNQTAFSYGVDITQYFFLTNWFAIRADLTNHWTTESVLKYQTTTINGVTTQGGAPVGNNNNLDTTFLIGFTFYY